MKHNIYMKHRHDEANLLHLFFKELERNLKAPLSIRPEAASLVELLAKLNTGFR